MLRSNSESSSVSGRGRLLVEQRHRSILEVLATQGSATVRELHQRLNVSPETIRRDIAVLAERSQLRKAHGGAISIDAVEPGIRERLLANAEEKKAIGTLAASLVPDGAAVILDCGSTVQCVADALVTKQRLTVITNDLAICSKLAHRNGNQVHLLGGKIQDHEDGTIGPDTIAMLRQYVADYSFVGAGGITPDLWLMDYSREASELRQVMLESARHSVIVADHTKFDHLALVRVDNFERITHLITDSKLSPSKRSIFKNMDVELLIAEL